jgi:hypothetical protein
MGHVYVYDVYVYSLFENLFKYSRTNAHTNSGAAPTLPLNGYRVEGVKRPEHEVTTYSM